MNRIKNSDRRFAAFSHLVVDPTVLLANSAKFESLVDQVLWACHKLGGVAGGKGSLVLFLDTTWQYLFPDLRPDDTFDVAAWMERTRALRTQMEDALRKADCPVRLIMADDLERLLATAPLPSSGRSLSRLFAGESSSSRYDVPKLVKWLIQAANPGVPVATFDWDVLAHGSASRDAAITSCFARSTEALLKAAASAFLAERPFVMSGQYLAPARSRWWTGSHPAWVGWELDALNGSATRTAFLCQSDPKTGGLTMQFDAVRAFFHSLNSLRLAPPFEVSISGAGQIMSDDCLKYPPWMHFSRNVVWCDDYLLHASHVARGLIAAETPCIEPEAIFTKPRVATALSLAQKDIDWLGDNYFPGLIMGAIVCAWTNRDVLARLEKCTLSPTELWELARAQLNAIVAEWTQPVYAATQLADFMNRASTSQFAPQGIAHAVAELPQDFPGFATTVPTMPSLQVSLQTLIEDFLMIPECRNYWRDFLAEFKESEESGSWTI